MPANLPSDWAIRLAVTGGLSPGADINVDDVYCQGVTYFAGFNAGTVPGSTPFARGDKFTATVTSTEGKFQGFFRVEFNCQLPSAAASITTWYAMLTPYLLFTGSSVGNTINETLAT